MNRPSLDGWDRALKSAEDVLLTLREAESHLRQATSAGYSRVLWVNPWENSWV
jgi:hypothetical protein